MNHSSQKPSFRSQRPARSQPRKLDRKPALGRHSPTWVYESSGPDGKIRGTAQQIVEKYNAFARDANMAGDRIAAETYFQHAEHYARIHWASQPINPLKDPERDDQSPNDERQPEGIVSSFEESIVFDNDSTGGELNPRPQSNSGLDRQPPYGRPQRDSRDSRERYDSRNHRTQLRDQTPRDLTPPSLDHSDNQDRLHNTRDFTQNRNHSRNNRSNQLGSRRLASDSEFRPYVHPDNRSGNRSEIRNSDPKNYHQKWGDSEESSFLSAPQNRPIAPENRNRRFDRRSDSVGYTPKESPHVASSLQEECDTERGLFKKSAFLMPLEDTPSGSDIGLSERSAFLPSSLPHSSTKKVSDSLRVQDSEIFSVELKKPRVSTPKERVTNIDSVVASPPQASAVAPSNEGDINPQPMRRGRGRPKKALTEKPL